MQCGARRQVTCMENLDIWWAAQQLIQQYDAAAEMEAAMRLERAVRERNAGGAEMWRAVLNAVHALIEQKSGPGGPFN